MSEPRTLTLVRCEHCRTYTDVGGVRRVHDEYLCFECHCEQWRVCEDTGAKQYTATQQADDE